MSEEKFILSGECEKFLIQIFLDNGSYFTVAGNDTVTNKDDLYLSDSEKVLLFDSYSSLKRFILDIKNEEHIFDIKNMKKWIKAESLEPYRKINFAALIKLKEYAKFPDIDEYHLNEIFTLIEVGNDLVHQFGSHKVRQIAEIVKSRSIIQLNEYCYDSFIFTKEADEPIPPFSDEKSFRVLLSNLESLLVAVQCMFRFVIYHH